VTDPAPTTTTPIVVAVNGARRCRQTLELAAALATSVGAHLEVVFVEDANLLRLADVPVTREVDRISGMTRALDSRRILRALRCETRQLRRELSRIGKTTSVRATVRVVRGHYLTEALAASTSVNVTFVHATGQPPPGEHLSSASVRPFAAGTAHGRVQRRGGERPPWTLFDDSPASHRALAVAVKLAGALACRLVVVLSARDSAEIERRKRAAQTAAGRVELRYLVVPENRFSELSQALAPGAGSLLVLARQGADPEYRAARSTLASIAVPVVLVA